VQKNSRQLDQSLAASIYEVHHETRL